MQRYALFFVFFLFAVVTLAAEPIVIKSEISNATVFLKGAQVFRSGSFSAPKGVTKVVFDDVSAKVNPKSLQAKAMGDFKILDVKHNIHYVEPKPTQEPIRPERIQNEIGQLEDSILFKSFDLDRINARIKTLEDQKAMIINNSLMKGGGKSDSLPILKQAVDYYHAKLNQLNESIYDLRFEKHSLEAVKHRMQNRMNDLRQFANNVGQPQQPAREVHQVIVTLHSEKPVTGNIALNYLVNDAGWLPGYDLRASGTNDPMMLTYKAEVFQNTGKDWSDIRLTLSTFNQDCNNTKPELDTWFLDYVRNNYPDKPFAASQVGQVQMASNFAQPVKNAYSSAQLFTKTEAAAKSEQESLQSLYANLASHQSFTNVEFEVTMKYDIPSDGKSHLMVIQERELDVEFEHFVLPKVSRDAFLLARIGNWEELSLLPARTNIYLDNTFVGTTDINPQTLSDTLEVAMGRDKGIYTTRKKIADKEKNVGLGKRTERSITFEIVVKNNKNVPVSVVLEDQFPVTNNDDISIEADAGDRARVDEEKGRMTWNLILPPGRSQSQRFTYTITHAKGKRVS